MTERGAKVSAGGSATGAAAALDGAALVAAGLLLSSLRGCRIAAFLWGTGKEERKEGARHNTCQEGVCIARVW